MRKINEFIFLHSNSLAHFKQSSALGSYDARRLAPAQYAPAKQKKISFTSVKHPKGPRFNGARRGMRGVEALRREGAEARKLIADS